MKCKGKFTNVKPKGRETMGTFDLITFIFGASLGILVTISMILILNSFQEE